MANETVAQAVDADVEEAALDTASCIRGARNILELMAEQLSNEGSQLAANTKHSEECLWGVMRLLQTAESHLRRMHG